MLNALGRFGAFLFRSAPAMPTEALLTQMRLNGNWLLAKGIDFEGTFRLELDDHELGLNVGPNIFEPSTTPPANPTATLQTDIVTMTNLLNAGLTLAEAESSGALRILGKRRAALALLDKLALGPHLRHQIGTASDPVASTQ